MVEGFVYALTSGGNITRTTHADGSYWDYAYDARDRLTAAVRKDGGGQTLAAYAYTYDAGHVRWFRYLVLVIGAGALGGKNKDRVL